MLGRVSTYTVYLMYLMWIDSFYEQSNKWDVSFYASNFTSSILDHLSKEDSNSPFKFTSDMSLH